MCITMIPAVFAASEVGMTLTATATGKSNGTYDVVYKATLVMDEEYAQKAATVHPANMADYRFICVLEDGLVEQLTNPAASQFTFDGPGAVNFIYDSLYKGTGSDADKLYIEYKLNVDHFNGMSAEEIKTELQKSMTMTSIAMNVTAAQLNSAKEGDGKVHPNGAVLVDNGVNSKQVDNAVTTLTVDDYSGGGGGSGGGSGSIGDDGALGGNDGHDIKDVSDTHWGRYEIAEASTDHGHSVNSEYTDETWHN